jgi:pyruvate formate lyase activating enzyme
VLNGTIFNIQRFSVHDGPGIRSTVFLKGCPLSCWWCHNPESQAAIPQVLTNESRCIHCNQCIQVCDLSPDEACRRCGACVEACPTGARQMIGRVVSVEEVLSDVLKDRMFYDDSGGGVTISGGEPLLQPEFAIALLSACRYAGLHAALDTCGFAPPQRLLEVAAHADLVLYDVKVVCDEKHRLYTGVSNQRILENLGALAAVHPNIWLRVPLIPGLNDDDDDLAQLAELARSIASQNAAVRKLSILPYHDTAAAKFQRLGRTYALPHVQVPTAQRLASVASRLARSGLEVSIGK